MMPSTHRERLRATSGPSRACRGRSRGREVHRVPTELRDATSNVTRVRTRAFSKMSANVFPASVATAGRPSPLLELAASRTAQRLVAGQIGAERKCASSTRPSARLDDGRARSHSRSSTISGGVISIHARPRRAQQAGLTAGIDDRPDQPDSSAPIKSPLPGRADDRVRGLDLRSPPLDSGRCGPPVPQLPVDDRAEGRQRTRRDERGAAERRAWVPATSTLAISSRVSIASGTPLASASRAS